MGFEPFEVIVNGMSVRLFRGATVRHALISAAAGSELVNRVLSGQCRVWDNAAKAWTDLGGALYPGQRLEVREEPQ